MCYYSYSGPPQSSSCASLTRPWSTSLRQWSYRPTISLSRSARSRAVCGSSTRRGGRPAGGRRCPSKSTSSSPAAWSPSWASTSLRSSPRHPRTCRPRSAPSPPARRRRASRRRSVAPTRGERVPPNCSPVSSPRPVTCSLPSPRPSPAGAYGSPAAGARGKSRLGRSRSPPPTCAGASTSSRAWARCSTCTAPSARAAAPPMWAPTRSAACRSSREI
mmetsp:Transcript_31145/g.79540  ORF Transcript_31145/g.79540 Transcript_31145/m.79540 type:complete len:218 (+) Transcript_31145:824-1477(+)